MERGLAFADFTTRARPCSRRRRNVATRLLVAADGASTFFAASGIEPLSVSAPVAPAARAEKRGVLSRWWFWTGVGAAVVGAVVLGVVLSSGGGETTIGVR